METQAMGSSGPASPGSELKALEGERLKKIYGNAGVMAGLHTTLTSRRGDYFRMKLLQELGEGKGAALLERLRKEAGVQEYERHIQKLLKYRLVEKRSQAGGEIFVRTADGEKAVNAMRELERDIGEGEARRIYEASLGPHSIQLFLRLYSDRRTPDFKTRRLKYSPAEVGQLAYFLPRSVEALAAVDKLNEAGLLFYEEDGQVYAVPTLLRGFYKYLLSLHEILERQKLLQ